MSFFGPITRYVYARVLEMINVDFIGSSKSGSKSFNTAVKCTEV